MAKKRKTSIGIDIGSQYMKIVALEYSEDTIEIDRYIIQKTPTNLVVNGVIQLPEDLGEVIKIILSDNDIRAKKVSISIPVGEETGVLKWVTVPDLNPKEMEKAVASVLEDELLRSPDTLYYNWQRVDPNVTNDDGSVSIILVGVPKESVDNHLKFLKKMKVKPYFAEVDIFSHLRSLIEPKLFSHKLQNKMIVDIGATETIVGFIQEGCFAYVRSIPKGTNLLTEAIAKGMDVEYKKAEEELIQYGSVAKEITYLPFDAQPVAEIVSPIVESLIEDLEDTLMFYKEMSEGTVDEVILTGGGAKLDGITEFFTSKIDIPTTIGVPYFLKKEEEAEEETKKTGDFFIEEEVAEKPKSPLEKDLPLLNVAIGLALKEVQDNV